MHRLIDFHDFPHLAQTCWAPSKGATTEGRTKGKCCSWHRQVSLASKGDDLETSQGERLDSGRPFL